MITSLQAFFIHSFIFYFFWLTRCSFSLSFTHSLTRSFSDLKNSARSNIKTWIRLDRKKKYNYLSQTAIGPMPLNEWNKMKRPYRGPLSFFMCVLFKILKTKKNKITTICNNNHGTIELNGNFSNKFLYQSIFFPINFPSILNSLVFR